MSRDKVDNGHKYSPNQLTGARLTDLARMLREWADSEMRFWHRARPERLSVGERHILEDAAEACDMALASLSSDRKAVIEECCHVARGLIVAGDVLNELQRRLRALAASESQTP